MSKPEAKGGSVPSAISYPTLSLPEGGGATSYGETFQPNEFTGTASLSIPVYVTPGRGQTPKLALRYHSGGGNSSFGFGFSLDLPTISRRTDKGTPRYAGTDTFLFSDGGQLVPRYAANGSGWIPDQRMASRDGVPYLVTTYRPRVEQTCDLIEQWTDRQTGDCFWQVTDRDGGRSLFGFSSDARICDPAEPGRVYEWLVEETVDTHGSRIRYQYKQENDENVPPAVYARNRSNANKYIERILYGNYGHAQAQEQFAFEVLFDYGEYSLDPPNLTPVRPWAMRSDPFSTHRPGFEIRTNRLCHNIMMVHHLPGAPGAADSLVSAMHLTYEDGASLSLLRAASRVGYRMQPDGTYLTQAMPPLAMSYVGWEPQSQRFQGIHVDGHETLPGLPGQGSYQLIDLYGDGLPGLLYADLDTLLYWQPQGGGRYAQPQPLPQFPSEHQLSGRRYGLMDVTGTGHLDLVVGERTRGGYYRNHNDGSWAPYQDFVSYTPEFNDPATVLVDLDGNGLADLFTGDGPDLRYYPSLGEPGFGPPVTLPATGVPVPRPGSASLRDAFADMFGDGLSHRVRISDGNVTVWPSLGNGRFGPKVVLADAPRFGPGLTTDRIFLADVSGTGTADLLFLYADHFDVYVNQAGNSFAPALRFDLPLGFDLLDQAQVADVLGTGLPSLVISKAQPSVAHHFFDFCGGRRPHLLAAFTNGMGLESRITYRSSTDYYLKDRESGHPWVTKLAFPVSVVACVATVDPISASQFVTAYQYSDGFYDKAEAQFRGFGCVKWQDSNTFDTSEWHYPTGRQDAPPTPADSLPPVEPLLTLSWNHTGAYLGNEVISRQFAAQYFHGDPLALELPDSAFSAQILSSDAETVREAYHALADHRLHTEEYGVSPAGAALPAPYRVSEQSYAVRMLQPRIDGHHAVFRVTEQESALSEYDSQADDPRIAQTFTLAADDFGNVLRSARLYYPRREGPGDRPLPDQARLTVTVDQAAFINHGGDTGTDAYLIGCQCELRQFELGGLSPGTNRYFTFAAVAAQVEAALANPIPYGAPFTSGTQQARLYSWWQDCFWNTDRTAPLPLGEISARALLHHRQQAVFSDYLVAAAYDGRVTPELLTADGGYRHADGYWWNDGLTQFYLGQAGYFLPAAVEDTFGARTQYEYDAYCLQIIRATDCLGQVTVVVPDYAAMKPGSVTDHNQNTAEALYDPLTAVMATALHGAKDGRPVGNTPLSAYKIVPNPTIESVLAHPERYLQGAGCYFYYNLGSWLDDTGQPAHSILLHAHAWINPGDGAPPTGDAAISCTVAYFDGTTRTLCKKSLVEAGTDSRWLTTDRVAYDDRGDAVRRYLPYFTPTAAWDPEPAAPVTQIAYDALGCEVQSITPGGFVTRTVYAPWSRVRYDEDDTVVDSPYYRAHIDDPNLPPAERAALKQAARFYDTPTHYALNNQGQEIQVTRMNVIGTDAGETQELLKSYTWTDIAGNPLRMVNPRFYNERDPDKPEYYDFINSYDMASRRIALRSADAGNKPITGPDSGVPVLSLDDTADQPIHLWEQRGFHVQSHYDALRRLIRVHVTGDGLDQDTELFTYGSDANANTVGQVVQHNDQAGVVWRAAFDLLGNPVRQETRLRTEHKGEVNWNDPGTVLLGESWQQSWAFDAAGLLTEEVNADGSRCLPTYFANGWVREVSLSRGGQQQAAVKAVAYHPSGAPLSIALGNGVTTGNTYGDQDYRLVGSRSRRTADGRTLQDLHYTYDPVGNVTRVHDEAAPAVLFPQSQANPGCDYTYDAIYQLRAATGRQQPTAGDGQPLEPYVETYGYDRSGNLDAIAHTAAQSWVRRLAVPASSNQAVPAGGLPSAGLPDCFDAAGNQVRLENIRTMAYDYRSQMSSATVLADDGAHSSSDYFVYNSVRQRTRQVSERPDAGEAAGQVTDTVYVGNLVVTDRAAPGGGAPVRSSALRLMFGDRCILIVDTAAAGGPGPDGDRLYRYQLADRLGSVTLEVDQAGEAITYAAYFPYGGTAAEGGAAVSSKRYRYSGKELDESTGLYYYGVRYYIPWLGRWTTPDPAGTVDGLNLFRFVRNNPVSLYDVKGENPDGQENESQKAPVANAWPAGMKQFSAYGLVLNALSEGLFKGVENKWAPIFHKDTPAARIISGLFISKIAAGAQVVAMGGYAYAIPGIYKNGWQSSYGASFVATTAMAQEVLWLHRALIAKTMHDVEKASFRAGVYGGVADVIKAGVAWNDGKYKDFVGYSLLGAGNFAGLMSPQQTEAIYLQMAKLTAQYKVNVPKMVLQTASKSIPTALLFAGAAVMRPKSEKH